MAASNKKPRKNASELEALVASRVPVELRHAIELRAVDTPGGMSAVVREALAEYVGRPELARDLSGVAKEAA